MKKAGFVKWFDHSKGFGTVATPRAEYFLHKSNCAPYDRKLATGQAVVFEVGRDDKKDRAIALNCSPLGKKEDWSVLMLSLEDKSDTVLIEEVVSGVSRWGNPYKSKENISYHILTNGGAQLFRQLDADQIHQVVFDYYLNNLNPKFINEYLTTVYKCLIGKFGSVESRQHQSVIEQFFLDNVDQEKAFYIWKTQKFSRIGKFKEIDPLLDQNTLVAHIDEIDENNLRRLKGDENYNSYANQLAELKFQNIEAKEEAELLALFSLLDFFDEHKKGEVKSRLDLHYSEKVKQRVLDEVHLLGDITNDADYLGYYRKVSNLPGRLSDVIKQDLVKDINAIIVSKCSKEFLPELWLKGVVQTLDFDRAKQLFEEETSSITRKVDILLKLDSAEQATLLKTFQDSDTDYSEKLELFLLWIQKGGNVQNDIQEIHNDLIANFSFTIEDAISEFEELVNPEFFNDELRQAVVRTLESELNQLQGDLIIDIFRELNDYQLIASDNTLLYYLTNHDLYQKDLAALISIINDYDINQLKELIKKNISNLTEWDRISLLEQSTANDSLFNLLADMFIHEPTSEVIIEPNRIIRILDGSENEEIVDVFVDKVEPTFLAKNALDLLRIAHKKGLVVSEKKLIHYVDFTSEREVLSFIELHAKSPFIPEVLNCNNKLNGFVHFFSGANNYHPNEDCKSFFEENMGISHALSVKRMIQAYSQKKIDKSQLRSALESFAWTEISALLLKHVVLSESRDKILLSELDAIFKAHFEILSNHSFTKERFIQNFKIGNILNKCDGRTFYESKLWQGGDTSRKYVNKTPALRRKESMNCYCEGRPWKKETFWDSETNRPIAKEFDLYWCKNNACALRNDKPNLERPFNEWTIQDISSIVGIEFEKLFLSTLSGWANRMNQIVDHLFCRDCGDVLRPIPFSPTNLGYYAVPLFKCINPSCGCNEVIRFTHCLNSKCESHIKSEPLDSRDCESCRPEDPNHTGLRCRFCSSPCPSCSGDYTKRSVIQTW